MKRDLKICALSLLLLAVGGTSAGGADGQARSGFQHLVLLEPAKPSTRLGVGYLGVRDRRELAPSAEREMVLGARWLELVELPVYIAPGRPLGRYRQGWLEPAAGSGRHALVELPMAVVEIDGESAAFVVLEEAASGWLRVAGLPGAPGEGWVLREDLAESPLPLVFERWQEVLAREQGPLFFRLGSAAEPLFVAPETGAAKLGELGTSAQLVPLEWRGDWLRVRAIEPAAGCDWQAAIAGGSSRTREGWIRWQDAATGSRLWWAVKGC